MLRRMALASAKVLAIVQTPCRRSSLLCIKDALQVPALSRSLTGGEVREAARNAKAYLLRAHAASSQATDAQTAAPAQSSFLNLSVDDRVVVSPAAHLFGVMVRNAYTDHGVRAGFCLQGRLQENDVQKPTAVQEAAIPAIISGRNVAMQCYTGSGKVCTCFVCRKMSATHLLHPLELCKTCIDSQLQVASYCKRDTRRVCWLAHARFLMQTLAYLLPVLSKAIQNAEKEFVALQQQGKAHEAGTLQALVVVPSRELAMQIVRVAQGLLPHDARATIQQCIGGANPNRQVHLVYMLHHPPLSK